MAAIGKLRAAISQLNREGRERLLGFAEVNQHFKALFKKLFGGGTAELQLTDADDPLEAGVEILASPQANACNHYHYCQRQQALTAPALFLQYF